MPDTPSHPHHPLTPAAQARAAQPRAIPARAATLRDVARMAGVSQVAVSAVLHGSAGNNTRVSEATRQRIVKSASELRYTPNGVARALRRRRTNIIGLYLGDRYLDTHGRFMAEVVGGLQLGCHQHHKDLLIHGTFRGRSVDDVYAELVDGRIDGLVMFVELGDPLVERLAAAALPVVAIADAATGLPSVVVDDAGGSALLADYLSQKGHRSVLYRKGPVGQTSARRRHTAFLEMAQRRGMTVLEDSALYCGAGSDLSAPEQEFLSLPNRERPTAIACWSDALADHTVECCAASGLRVPGDIAIVGFDGLEPDYRPALLLTTVRAPWSEVARLAVELLERRFGGEEVPEEAVLPVAFVQGDSA